MLTTPQGLQHSGLDFYHKPDFVKNTIVSEDMSDHILVLTELELKTKPLKRKPRKIFLFKRADVERLRDSISNDLEALRSTECESASELESTILKAVEEYVPQKKIPGHWHGPWLTQPPKRVIRKKERLYRKAKQLQTHESWAKFKKATKRSLQGLRLQFIGDHNKPWPSHLG